MSDFEYIFTFYALLMGLAVANVASGFGDMWRERKVMPIGYCAPFLGLIILLAGMNIWLRYWHDQHPIRLSPWWLMSAACVTIPYIFISRAMFPATSEPQPLEDHFLAQRHVLLGALAVPPFVSTVSNVTLGSASYTGFAGVWMIARILSPLALIPFRNVVIQRIGLLLIIAVLVAGLFRW